MFARQFRSSRTFLIVVVGVANFSDVFIYGLVVPVMPFALTVQVGLDASQVQLWNSLLLAILGAATSLGSLAAGILSDRYQTRRLPFLIGLLCLFASTLGFAFARTLVLLVIARCLQGVSTAVVTTIGFALVADVYGGPENEAERSREPNGLGRAMGWVSMCISLGWFAGPIVGGWIYDRVGYRAVFGPALACVGIDIVLRLLLADPEKGKHSGPSAHTVEGNRPMEEADVGNEREYGTTTTTGTASSATIAGSNYTTQVHSTGLDEQGQQERQQLLRPSRQSIRNRKSKPAMLVLISSFPFMMTILAATVLFSLLTAFDAVLPVLLKERFHLSSAQISLVFIALVLPLSLSPASGALADRIGTVKPSVAGFVLGALSLWALGYLDAVDRTSFQPVIPKHVVSPQLWLMLPILVAVGTSFSIALPAINSAVSNAVERIETRNPGVFGSNGANAQAFGLTHAGLGAGLVLGSVGAGLIKEHTDWMTMAFVLAGYSVIGMILVLAGRAGEIRMDKRNQARNGDDVL